MTEREKETLRLVVELRKERDALNNEIETLKPEVLKILKGIDSVKCNGFLIEYKSRMQTFALVHLDKIDQRNIDSVIDISNQ